MNTAPSGPELTAPRLLLLIGMLTCAAHPSWAQDDRTWQGGGATSLWSSADNWVGGTPPASSSAGILTFPETDTSRMDAGYATGDLTFGSTGHTIELDGKLLETAGIRFALTIGARGNIAGPGTIRLGSAGAPADIRFADERDTRLDIGEGVTLGGHIGMISGRSANGGDSWLDLRGAIIENGILDINTIEIGERTYINLDDTTAIDTLRIHDALRIYGRRGRWIGNPADTQYRRLPTNLVVVVGSMETPAILDLGVRTASSYFDMGPVHFNASTGGSFTGRLSRLRVAHSNNGGTGPNNSTMDLSGMTACDIVTAEFNVGTSNFDYSSAPSEAGPVRGTVKLPPGGVQAGTLIIGRTAPRDAVNWADLELNGTRVTITNAASVLESGLLTINIGGTASGLALLADATLTVDGQIHVVFTTEPDSENELHYGLSWEGDHAAALQALVAGNAITVDDTALSQSVSVYVSHGVTYLGVPPPSGPVIQVL